MREVEAYLFQYVDKKGEKTVSKLYAKDDSISPLSSDKLRNQIKKYIQSIKGYVANKNLEAIAANVEVEILQDNFYRLKGIKYGLNPKLVNSSNIYRFEI
jgi:hypothetical protein